ncbi:hypothetical protein BC629DRAFT_1533368 [Irpex lacteus]|nr:hypothetical protein BC629DRAFT_1533368 [Irpex lacteus]
MSTSALLDQELIGSYITRSATGLFFYECIITLSQEVDVVWRRKWTAITWLYALTRYCEVLDQIVTFLPVGNLTALIHIDAALHLVQPLCYGWFSALRVYALFHDRRLVAVIVFLLNLVPFATNMFNYTHTAISANEVCIAVPTESSGLHLSLSLLTRMAVIMSDVLVLAVTWTKTAQAYGEAKRLKIKAPLARMLLRDVSNVLEVIDSNIPVMEYLSVIEPFFDILPQIIVCRFILNLRQLEPTGTSWISDSKSHSLHFVGNMGQSLHTGGTDEDEENGVDEIEVVPARTRFSSENTTPTEAAEVNGRRVYELWTQQGITNLFYC